MNRLAKPVPDLDATRDLLVRGVAALNAGRAEEAARFLDAAAALSPDQPDHHHYAGLAHLGQSQARRALECFRRALALAPLHQGARSGAWRAALLLGEQADGLAESGCPLPVWFRLDGPGLALTIDDGPTPETTPLLLDVLARHGVTATFFLLGLRAEAHPEQVAAIVAAGHDVQAHGASHRPFIEMSEAELIGELSRTEQALSRFRPTPARPWLRLPYGRGWDVPAVHRAVAAWNPAARLAQWGPALSEWNVADSQPQPGPSFDAACAEAAGRVAAQATDGAILLAHDQLVGVASATAALAGPAILDLVLARVPRPGPLPR